MSIRATYWTLAIIGSLLIHAFFLFSIKHEANTGALDLGSGGIHASVIELRRAVQGSNVSAPEKQPTEQPEESKVIPKKQPKAEKIITKTKKVEPEKVPVIPNKPVMAVKETKQQKTPIKPKPKLEPLNQVARQQNSQSSTVADTTSPDKQIVKATPSRSGATYTGGSSTKTSAGGAAKKAKSEYLSLLKSLLEKEKHYPERARKRRQEGIVYLWFKIDSNGTLLEYKIKESSGHKTLDKEVEELIKRVTPFPKFPSDLEIASMKITMPMSFKIK